MTGLLSGRVFSLARSLNLSSKSCLSMFADIFTLARSSAGTLAVLLTLLWFPSCANAKEGFNRKAALANMDRNVERVRQMMDGDTKELERLLIWYMANPAGDHPKILAVCTEIIEKSTKPANVWVAVQAVGSVIDAHSRRKTLTDKRKTAIAEALKKAQSAQDLRVKFWATDTIARLGGPYTQEANSFYLRLLQESRSPRDDDDRWGYVRAIKSLMDARYPEADAAIRKFTVDHEMLSFYQSNLRAGTQPGSKSEGEKFLDRWQILMDGERNK